MKEIERIHLKLYGVITEILPEGQISVCEPVFSNCWNPMDKNLYRLITEKVEKMCGINYIYPKALEKIDISQFGKPLFLPVSKNKISDGKKYFIIFQSSKNAMISSGRSCNDVPIIRIIDSEYFTRRNYLPVNITVGIKFPDKFIVITERGKKYSAEELKKFIRDI